MKKYLALCLILVMGGIAGMTTIASEDDPATSKIVFFVK